MVMRMTCKDCIHCDVCLLCKEINADKAVRMFDFDCPEFRGKADFVEVVRCGKCKHWIYWADEKRCSCDLHHTHTSRDDFCGYGERRKENVFCQEKEV